MIQIRNKNSFFTAIKVMLDIVPNAKSKVVFTQQAVKSLLEKNSPADLLMSKILHVCTKKDFFEAFDILLKNEKYKTKLLTNGVTPYLFNLSNKNELEVFNLKNLLNKGVPQCLVFLFIKDYECFSTLWLDYVKTRNIVSSNDNIKVEALISDTANKHFVERAQSLINAKNSSYKSWVAKNVSKNITRYTKGIVDRY